MTDIANTFLLAAATYTVLLLWFKGSIFAVKREQAKLLVLRDHSILYYLGELSQCWLCLSVHVATILTLLFLLPALFIPFQLSAILRLPLTVLAAVAFANFGGSNDT